MSFNRTKKEDDGSGEGYSLTSMGIVGGLGLAIGAGLAYFLGESNEGPQCHASVPNNTRSAAGNTSSSTSSTFRNRQPVCEQCTVCLDPVGGVTLLPCTHRFHTKCLQPWLRKQRTCPTCRQPVPVGSEIHF